ncbi:MAG: UDP-N-acetylmuramate:L-alanyl-gamma-D-glutamyl-meso-diaminopimelate ligase [SAR324 cluster bacterium]|nr:UDP-N-acetylmuramate:L-alanyl-gamma-D-glutamyl-meso-diaminopimelate ligase [SAR324 cluster bacterium]
MTSKHFHFSGICGTAMASLAVLLKERGHKITGSDENIYPPMSTLLEEKEIEVFQGYHASHLEPKPDYVVLGNALSRGNAEVEHSLKEHLHYLSMAELLKNEFIRGNKSLVISGTHGKSTTTSLAAHMFTQAEKPTGFLVGGIPLNFGTSCLDVEKGGYFVVEGDEYDTSFFDKRSKFFHYLPDRLVITNIEFDHADIYNNIEEIKRSFTLMLRQMPANGLIIANGDDEDTLEVARKGFCPLQTYGFGKGNEAIISNITPLKGQIGVTFDLGFGGKSVSFEINMFGEHNVMNATAVILLARHEGISDEVIQVGLKSFKGVRRRLELLTENPDTPVFDDFAHHPTAILETIKGLRMAWPEATIHAIYEARSNTSISKVHQIKMAKAFAEADRITFYKLHRKERLHKEELLDLNQVVAELLAQGKQASHIKDLDLIKSHVIQKVEKGDIILVMSQGSFGGLASQLAKEIDKRHA